MMLITFTENALELKKFISPKLRTGVQSPLTTDSEGAARKHLPVDVSHCVVALVCLRHSLCHPHLAPSQQPTPACFAGFRVRVVPQHHRHGLRRSSQGRKLQHGAIFRDAVFKVLAIVLVVGLNAF